MSRRWILAVVVAVLVAAVQSWRLHSVQQELFVAKEKLSLRPVADALPNARSTSSAYDLELQSTVPEDMKKVLAKTSAPTDGLRDFVLKALAAIPMDEDVKGKADALDDKWARREAKKANRALDGDRKASRKEDARLLNQIAGAKKAIKQGLYDDAIAQLQDVIATTPDNAHAYRTLADVYRKMGLVGEELQVYADWSAARPDDAQAHFRLASAYEAQGWNSDALAELQQYEALSGDNPAALTSTAAMYRRLGMPAEEEATLASWVDAAPDSVQARMALADFYRRTGESMSAEEQYLLASQLEPGNIAAHMRLATVYQQTGQHDAAQAELLYALELHPGDQNIWMRLGESYRREGDIQAAVATYQSVISMEPDSAEAQQATRQIARLERLLQS